MASEKSTNKEKSSLANTIKKDFTLIAILLIPISVAINIVGGQLADALKLPIYLDSIGTVLSAILAGPWVGVVVGVLSNLINGIFNSSYIPYTIVSIAIGLVTGYLARFHWFEKHWKVFVSGIVIGLVSTVIGTPITVWVYGGVNGSGSTFITAFLEATGHSLWTSVTTAVLLSNLLDKVLAAIIAFFVVDALPIRYLSKFSLGSNYLKLTRTRIPEAKSQAA